MWKKRDPILTFRRRLIEDFQVATAEELDAIEARIQAVMGEAVEFARNVAEAGSKHGAPVHVWNDPINPPMPAAEKPVPDGDARLAGRGSRWDRRGDAARSAHDLSWARASASAGEVSPTPRDLWKEFGAGRVDRHADQRARLHRRRPRRLGHGCRAVADLMFVEFLFEAASQIILQAAKLRYMSNNQMSVPMVMRAACGAVRGAGPHHSGILSSALGPCPGSDRGDAVEPGRRQGVDEDRAPGLRPGDFSRTQDSVWQQGRGAHRRTPSSPSARPRSFARATDLTIVALRADGPGGGRRGGRALEQDGISCEVIDPRTDRSARRGNDRRQRGQDRPSPDRGRGLLDVRDRGRDRRNR